MDTKLSGKSDTSHTHTPASIGAATSEQGTKADNALPKSGGTMSGALTLNSSLILKSGAGYGTASQRPAAGTPGRIWFEKV